MSENSDTVKSPTSEEQTPEEKQTDLEQYYSEHPIDSIEKLRVVFHKWLEYGDETLLNLIIATACHTEWMQNQWLYPLWLAVLGASGIRKTEVTSSLCRLASVIKVELITENTFVTGHPDFSKNDLAPQLKNKLMITLDFAPLLNKDSRMLREIMSQMRRGYEGEFCRRTGSGVSVDYKDIYFNWILCSTSSYDKSEVIRSEIGQRELLYRLEYEDPKPDPDKVKEKIKFNSEHLQEMRFELQLAVYWFIRCWKDKNIKYNDVMISPEMNKIIENLCAFIVYLRASVELDNYDKGDPKDIIEPEEPTRVYGQMCGWFKALKTIGLSDEEVIRNLKDIAKSSINRIRFRILKILKNIPSDKTVSIAYLTRQLGLGFKSVNGELMTLYQLKIVDYEGDEGEKRTWKIKKELDKDKKEMLEFIFPQEKKTVQQPLISSEPTLTPKTPETSDTPISSIEAREAELRKKKLSENILDLLRFMPVSYNILVSQLDGIASPIMVDQALQQLLKEGLIRNVDAYTYAKSQ